MPVELDIEKLVEAARAALPDATPNAAALMFLAQIPFVDAAEGKRVVDEIGRKFPPGAWYFDGGRLDAWPACVAECAMGHVRGVEPGWRRVLAFCRLAERLTHQERREAFAGIMDGTLWSGSWTYNKPTSFSIDEERLIRLVPAWSQEAWIQAQLDGDPLRQEIHARSRIQRWPGAAVRALYERLAASWSPGEGPPLGLSVDFFGKLPPDLRESALRRARLAPLQESWQLRAVAGELSDDEYREVMNPPSRLFPLCMAPFERLLPGAPYDVVLRWLDAMLCLEDSDRQFAVAKLLPLLRAKELRRAEGALAQSVLRSGNCGGDLWYLIADRELPSLLWRLRDDSYGWHRDALIEHIIADRDDAVAESCFLPLLDSVADLPADHRLEVLTAMTPWLSARTEAALPRALVRLPIQPSPRSENQQYTIDRVLEEEDDR